MKTETNKINAVLTIIENYGGIDGAHHKQWVLDQIVQILLDSTEDYLKWIQQYENGEEGSDTYTWDKGIAP